MVRNMMGRKKMERESMESARRERKNMGRHSMKGKRIGRKRRV